MKRILLQYVAKGAHTAHAYIIHSSIRQAIASDISVSVNDTLNYTRIIAALINWIVG